MDSSKDSQSRWGKTRGTGSHRDTFLGPVLFRTTTLSEDYRRSSPLKTPWILCHNRGRFVDGQQHCHLRQIKASLAARNGRLIRQKNHDQGGLQPTARLMGIVLLLSQITTSPLYLDISDIGERRSGGEQADEGRMINQCRLVKNEIVGRLGLE